MFTILLGLLAAALFLVWYYFTANFNYWKNRGIPYEKAYPLMGSMANIMFQKENTGDFFMRLYRKFDDIPFGGFFQGRIPGLVVKDPDLIKSIMIKDFSFFVDHGFKVDEEVDPLQAKNLFNMEGEPWREMRAILSPTFTSGRMKAMFPLVQEISNEFEKYLSTLADSKQHVDIKDLLARYTTDVISSCAFGIKRDSINNPDDAFRTMGRKMLEADTIQGIKNALIFFLPEISRRLKLRFFPEEILDFFRNLVKDVVGMRKKSGQIRKDFMQLMIQLQEIGRIDDGEETGIKLLTKWTDTDITAQAMVFFLAGFETSSSALTFAFYELARRPELQRKARLHIEEVLQRHDGQLSYQALQEMTYLDCILSESLRKYPPVTVLNRECNKKYKLPGTDTIIDKGTLITIPIYAMQNDPRYFPEPERFHPERFAEENQQNLQFVYMPFGEGPRQCIGLRFARMQSKLGLIAILRKFEVESSAKTSYPLIWDPKQFLLSAKEDIFVKIKTV